MDNCHHSNLDTFKQIFRDHREAFKLAFQRYNTPYYDATIQKTLDCGDPKKMGFAQYRCLHCGETRRIAFSCKSSFCLSCAKPYTDRWVDFIGRRLLPEVVYRHVILTVPDFLRTYFYRNPYLLSPLMQAGQLCLRDFFCRCAKRNLDIGTIIVLQTAGRSGHYNPHLHILGTAGGITDDGRWKSLSYFPYDLLHRKWQFHLLSMLRENVVHPNIQRDIDHGWKHFPKGSVAFIQEGNVPAGGGGLARYLAKYVVSPPISVRRIERYDGHFVRYWYKDHKTHQIQHETLPALTFIGRMVEHILPKGFQRIRYYGLHANARYASIRDRLPSLLPSKLPNPPGTFRVLPRQPFQLLFQSTWGKDPLLCPKCQTPMTLELLHLPSMGNFKVFLDIYDIQAMGIPDEPTRRPEQQRVPERSPLWRPERLLQIRLPFM